MKLLVCAPKLFKDGQTGGGERYATEFVRAMSRRYDVELQVVTGVGYRKLARVVGGTIDEPTTTPLSFREFRRAARDADLIHLFQLDSHIADLAFAATWRTGTPVVLSDLGGGWRAIGRGAGKWRYRRLAGLAAISQASVVDLGWPDSRPSTVIYGGGDHLAPNAGPGADPQFDFVFVGRLVEHKGVHLLLEALPDNASCLVAGAPLDATYLDQLVDMAPAGRVEFKLAPTDQEVIDAYAAARWSVSPTLAHVDGKKLRRPELLGLSPIESLALGTPAIMSDIPAYAELASLVGMPTFAADSLESLAAALKTCMSRPEVDLTASRAELTWGRVAEKSREFYAAVASS